MWSYPEDKDNILNSWWKKTKTKEYCEAQPLPDVRKDISGRGLGVVVGLSHLIVLTELGQTLNNIL